MKKLFACLLMVLFLSNGMLTTHASAHTKQDQLDTLLKDIQETYRIPDLSLTVVTEEGIYYEGSLGENVTSETPFLIGSISKPLTSLGTFVLIEKGTLTLDDPVHEHLPWFSYDTPYSEPMLVRHLLEQTSGMATEETALALDVFDREATADVVAAAAKELAHVSLNHRPGDTYVYDSANYLLLGAVIEAVSNQSFADFMKNDVFQPLSMSHTSAESSVPATLVPGHTSWFTIPKQSEGYFDPAGAPYGYMVSTSSDLGHFLSFLMNGGDIISDENKGVMLQQPTDSNYGYGWRFVNPFSTNTFPWHTGATPDQRAEVFFNPDDKIGVALLVNKYHQLEAEAYLSIMERVRSILAEEEVLSPLTPLSLFTQLIMVGVIGGIILLLSLVLVFSYKQKPLRFPFIFGVLCILLGLVLIPVFSISIQTPWRTIALYTPDVALLTLVLTALLLSLGVMLVFFGYRQRKKSLERTEIQVA
ncbi:serine hydrolase domain-containing protein [Alteribacter aurantiacus]|uniref:serine hydrolase domain-containing protein n=1 Tax=Alteribacter aurantiacus TaxID=254410 RepID=UPI00041610F2|nr:serine hydrolase domain-containing protein [Alteribacter aurantiacus]